MSLHTLAKHVQQKGRGKDQMLVHMSPKEVQGLQALAKAHGGSLTVNPETGLAEAGFLEQILPIVAMAAATYFTAGAAAPALSTALSSSLAGGMAAGTLAGAGVGAIGAAAQNKDVGQGALYGGIGGAISGGMGAYDGAASADLFTSGSTASGTPTLTPEAVNKISLDASVTGQIPGQSGMPVGDFPGSASDPTAGMAQAANAPPPGTPPAPGTPGGPPTKQFLEAYRPGVPTPSVEDKTKLDVAKSYYSGMGLPGKLATQALPGLAATMGMDTPQETEMPGTEPYTSASTLSPNFQGYTPRQPKPYYQAQYTRYAADGGLMALAGGGSAEEKKKKQRASLTADRTLAAMNADQAGLAMLNNARYGANMTGASPVKNPMTLGDLPNPVGAARGGLADLGSYSDGGRMLKGPGDGMSDSIPAQIGRKQPARLADGEFVVPADVVSHLGNGSTDAGAKRLYAMMDRARQARTGKKKQAPAVNADKILSRVA
jgi:hypothetical protein